MATAPTSPAKRRLPLWAWLAMGAGAMLVLLAALAIGLRYWIASDSGRSFLVSQIDGRKVGPLGVIRISGLDGDPLGAATVADIAFVDDDGVWMRARNARVEWTPTRLLRGDLEIAAVHVREVEVLRRPRTTYESSGEPGPNIGINLQEAAVDELKIAGGVFGTAASYRLAGGVARGRDGAGFLRIAVAPLTGPGDRIEADATWTADGALEGEASAIGPANGVLAGLLQAPEDTAIALDASIAGQVTAFTGALKLNMGDQPVLTLDVSRAGDDARFDADIAAGRWPLLDAVSQRTGDALRIEGRADLADRTAAPASLVLAAPAGRIELTGVANLDDPALPDTLQLNASGVDLARLAPDIAGRLDARGVLTLNGLVDLSWQGDAAVANLAFPSGQAVRVAGPLSLGVKGASISWRADALEGSGVRLDALDRLAPADYALGSRGSVNVATGIVEISQAQVRGAPGSVSARGTYGVDSGALDFAGSASLERLADLAPLSGAARGQWTVKRSSPTAPIRITADVAGRGVSAPNATLADLLGSAPRVKLSAVAHRGRFVVESGDVQAQGLSARMSGRVADSGAISGRAQGRLLRPLQLGSARLTSLGFIATVSGETASPRVNLRIDNGDVDLPGFPLAGVEGSAALTFGDQISGRFTLAGSAGGQPARVDGRVSGSGGDIRLAGVTGRIGGVDITAPQLAFADGAVRADFTANGSLAGLAGIESGALSASGELTAGDDGLVFDLDGRLSDLRRGPVLIRQLTFTGEAAGDTARVSGRLQGRIGARADIAYDVDARRDDDGAWAGGLALTGEYDRRPVATPQPVAWTYGADAWSVDGALNAFGGRLDLLASATPDGVRNRIEIADVELLALTRIARVNAQSGRMNGRVSGVSDFSNPAPGPATGDLTLTVADANPVGVTADPVTFRVAATLRDSVVAGTARGEGQGFTLTAEGRTRITEGEDFAITLDPGAPLAADLAVNGRADQLWAIFGPEGQTLRGQINSDVRVSGTVGEPDLDGDFAIADGAFEHGETGLRLTRIAADGVFTQRSARLTRFTASDANGGALTAQGAIDWVDEIDGGVTFTATRLRALGRDDRFAIVSGDGAVSLDTDAIRITGALAVEQARFSIEQPAAATIPTLPGLRRVGFGRADDADEPVPADRFQPVLFDIGVKADRRVFVTGRGVDSEWSADFKVGGSASAPRVDGSARLVRGSLDLAGRRFDLDSSLVQLAGPVSSARVDISATRDAEDVDATVRVSGTPDDLAFTLSSTPSLPQDEILSRVLFGRSAAQLSALEAAQLAAGLTQLAGGQAAFDPASLLRNATGLDRISFGASDGAATVSAGKYLADDVYLQVGAGGEGGVGAEVEWEPIDNVSIISSAQGNGDTRIAVRWKRDY